MTTHSDFTFSNLQKNKSDVNPKTQSEDAPENLLEVKFSSSRRKESDSISYQLLFQVCRTS